MKRIALMSLIISGIYWLVIFSKPTSLGNDLQLEIQAPISAAVDGLRSAKKIAERYAPLESPVD